MGRLAVTWLGILFVVGCGSDRPPAAEGALLDGGPLPADVDASTPPVEPLKKVFDVKEPIGLSARVNLVAVATKDNTIVLADRGKLVGAPFHVSEVPLTGQIQVQGTGAVEVPASWEEGIAFMTETDLRWCRMGAGCVRPTVLVSSLTPPGVLGGTMAFAEGGPTARLFLCPFLSLGAPCPSPKTNTARHGVPIAFAGAPYSDKEQGYAGGFAYFASATTIDVVAAYMWETTTPLTVATAEPGRTITGLSNGALGIVWWDDAGTLRYCDTENMTGACVSPVRVLTTGRKGVHALTGWLPGGHYWLEGDSVFTCDLSSTSCEPRALAELPGATYLAIGSRYPLPPKGTAPRKELTLYVATKDAVWAINE